MSSITYSQLPLTAGFMIGAGHADLPEVARAHQMTVRHLTDLCIAAKVAIGRIESFEHWVARDPARLEAWAVMRHAFRGVDFRLL